jgi:hypothetical protein
MKDRSAQNKKDEKDKAPRARRIVIDPEEKAKKGRWVTLLILFLSILFGYAFWR